MKLTVQPWHSKPELWITVEQQLLKLHRKEKKQGRLPKGCTWLCLQAAPSRLLQCQQDDLSPVRRTPLLSVLESVPTAEVISHRSPALKLEELMKIQTCRQKYILQTGGEDQRSPRGTSALWYPISLEASPRVCSSCPISFMNTPNTSHTVPGVSGPLLLIRKQNRSL